MNILLSSIILISVLLLTFGLTQLTLRFLTSKGLLVVPSQRSSHRQPKPQGGGISIVLILFISLYALDYLEIVQKDQFLYFLIPGLIVAVIGLFDDFWGVNPVVRISIHFLSAIIGILLIGGFPVLNFFGNQVDLGLLGIILGIIYIVWMVNLYNFMDGIDGLASLEAISVLLAFSVIYFSLLEVYLFPYLLVVISFSVLGFFILNFPKSKIILGDVGSTFLGLIIALISIYSSFSFPDFFWIWLILLGVFLVDSTFTLVVRIFRGEKFYLAHSSHAYQKIARKLDSHVLTTLLILLINLLWLFPIAFLVAYQKIEGILGVLIAYFPLIFIVYYLDAGLTDKNELDV